MKKLSLSLGFVACTAIVPCAFAVTIGELALKNNEFQALEIDLAIAKKKSELAPFTAPKNSLAIKAQKRSATADVDGLTMTEIFGDVLNPTVEFIQNGTVVIRHRGDTIGEWVIQSIKNRQAILIKSGKTSKSSMTRTIYLSAKEPPATYGQLNARNSVMPMPIPVPVYPQSR